MGAHAPTFGLDRPTRVSGAQALAPEALAMAAGFDHVPGLRSFLAEACRRQVREGRFWHGHPPLCLVGPEGFGRGLIARRIADLTGTPMVACDAADLENEVVGAQAGKLVIPTPIFAMALTRCANPTILLTVTNAGLSPQATRALAEWMDPDRSVRLYDERLRTVFDISAVSWIVQAPETSPALAAIAGENGRALETRLGAGPVEDLRRLAVAVQVAGPAPECDPQLVEAIFAALVNDFPAQARPRGAILSDHAANVRRGLRVGR
jgi:hypothetical protein